MNRSLICCEAETSDLVFSLSDADGFSGRVSLTHFNMETHGCGRFAGQSEGMRIPNETVFAWGSGWRC